MKRKKKIFKIVKTIHNEQSINRDQNIMELYYRIDILLQIIKRKQELGGKRSKV